MKRITRQAFCIGKTGAILFLAACLSGKSIGEDKPVDPEGRLMGTKAVTLADIYDAGSKSYLLYPGAPMARDMRIRPDERVGIIDSGIAHAHPQISGLIVSEKDWTGEGVEDVIGHGTIVALGLLYHLPMDPSNQKATEILERLGLKNSTAGLVVAKVASKDGAIKLNSVIEAIEWMAAQKVQLVNLSLAFFGEPTQFAKLKKAIEGHPDMFFFAAAGNLGPTKKAYPAALGLENVIAVAEDSDTSGRGDVVGKNSYILVTPTQYTASRQELEFKEGISLAQSKQFEKANAVFRRIAETKGHPFAAEAWCQLALYDMANNAYDLALAKLDEAEKLTQSPPPALASILALKGAAYFNKGDFASAKSVYQRSVTLDGGHAKVRYTLGLAFLRLKKFRSALSEFEATYQIDPKYPELAEILEKLKQANARGELPPEPSE